MAVTADRRVDVLIVGAGLSGIGAACQVKDRFPDRSVELLEARAVSGGTWDLFRYPAVRSDSDMFTLGYSFEPWLEQQAIADGPSILRYVRETSTRRGIDSLITFGRRALRATWSTRDAEWLVETSDPSGTATETIRCSWLWGATGYYRYDAGHRPAFEGEEDFAGQILHPQQWPDEVTLEGKRIVVIGSGATAVTLVPALARLGAQVTMLQRSPSYIVSRPDVDATAQRLRRLLPQRLAYQLVRAKNIATSLLSFQLSKHAPTLVRTAIVKAAARQLPEGYDVTRHFSPSYDPWDQRVCVTPNGDFFRAIRDQGVEVITETIDRLDERGIVLSSGQQLDADLIVTATGLQMELLGGIELIVDGSPVDVSNTVAYKGSMLSGVPNLSLSFGYTNASWTLKADLIAEWTTRLFKKMDRVGARIALPRVPDASVARRRFMDLDSGYVLRSAEALPKQIGKRPWAIHNNYLADLWLFRFGSLDRELELLP
jgi:cation diffusion facilitator CzcD-associated flavoprotein CzcO